METVTEQPIKKIEFFRCPQSLPGVAPLTNKPEDSGYEIVSQSISDVQVRLTYSQRRRRIRNKDWRISSEFRFRVID